MASRTYTVSYSETAVTAAVDLFELTCADDKPIDILGIFIGQSTDFGDAAAEVIPYKVIRGHATSGSGGSTATPRPLGVSDAAAGFTCETNNTTIASTGTAIDLHCDSFNVATGEKLWFPEDCVLEASQASLIVVRLMNAPADSLDLSATLYVREHG